MNPSGSTANLGARSSMVRPEDLAVAMFDDFTFAAGGTLGTVGWQGVYCREVLNAPAPANAATSFTVSFHEDNGGVPGATALQSITFPLAEVGETFDQSASAECRTTVSTWGFYNYSANLPTPFVAAPGTRYWLSVVANLPAADLLWAWRHGTPDNGDSIQLFLGAFAPANFDRAFSLGP